MDKSEIDKLILDHFDKAVAMAYKLLRSWRVRMQVDELKSIVGLALTEAAQRFDSSKQVAFSTFLFYYLRGMLLKEIARLVKKSKESFKLGITGYTLDKDSSNDEIVETYTNEAFSEEDKNPENILYRTQLEVFFKEICLELTNVEKDVIFLNLIEDKALIDVAAELKFTRSYVSRVKRHAIEKLQKIMLANPLLMDLLFDKGKKII
ncbi:MAG: sigma-70 family RNA polymerase sigma factor [Deltaproteobacteria bacterium]|jgi:RNA polymerase sigma factor (sigma-70 family)|nr:sigma-70 family RNA polymerase sigma factor [Deltaproteobacteria bacterium]